MRTVWRKIREPMRTIGPTFAANLLNQGIIALSQLAVIPLLVFQWGITGFGAWVLLTAVPNYLTISDLGFTTSAKSDMAIRAVRGDVAEAQVTSSSVAALLLVVLSAVALVYLSLVAVLDWPSMFNLPNVGNGDAQAVLCLGLVQLTSYQAFLLSASIVRAAGRPAAEVMLSAAFRALETLALVAVTLFGGGLVAAASAWAGTRLFTTVLLWIVLYLRVPHLVPVPSCVKLERIRHLLAPSLAYMLVPLGNAMLIQGTVLVLGIVSSPALVAAYSTMRIVTRLGVSASNTVNNAFTPQYSYAIGTGAGEKFRTLLRTHVQLMVTGTGAYIVVILIAGSWLVGILSHGQVEPSLLPLGLLAAAAALEMLWSMALSLGAASNSVGRLSVAFLVLSALSLILTYVLSAGYALDGASAAVAGTQLIMLGIAFIWWRQYRKAPFLAWNKDVALHVL